MKKIKLREICHSREGDKGDIANVSLIVYDKKNYELIRRQVTTECVKEFFKGIAKGKVERYEFPKLVTYNRFVHFQKKLLIPLFAYLLHRRGYVTGIAFIDATSLRVCHNKRITRNRVFKGVAKRGKTTAGWFYGLKLHLIVNDRGEILSFLLTPGNIADVSVLEKLSKGIVGKLFGDKGYISAKAAKRLLERGLHLFTTLRSNMKSKFISLKDKILLRKRSIIETINDQLKNISQIEHTRHRAVGNFLVNILSGLAAYSHQQKKPSLNFDKHLVISQHLLSDLVITSNLSEDQQVVERQRILGKRNLTQILSTSNRDRVRCEVVKLLSPAGQASTTLAQCPLRHQRLEHLLGELDHTVIETELDEDRIGHDGEVEGADPHRPLLLIERNIFVTVILLDTTNPHAPFVDQCEDRVGFIPSVTHQVDELTRTLRD